VADKVERVAKLAEWLAIQGIVPNCDPALARQAAELCKADLVTEMVGEFPELQGLMGGYYAASEGLPQEVAEAIRDHYKPVGQGDEVPTAPVTVAVSLADKLDTLVGFFGNKMPPTGSKDPFALRRAAIGVISLWLSNNLKTTIRDLSAKSIDTYRGSVAPTLSRMLSIEIAPFADDLPDELSEFLMDRLKVQQREAGVRHDLIDAVFALGGEDDLVRLLARVHALQAFIETDNGANLVAGYKRAANILKKEGYTAAPARADNGTGPRREGQGIAATGEEDPLALLGNPEFDDAMRAAAQHPSGQDLSYTPEPSEKALIDALDAAEPEAAAAINAEDFAGAMAALASLRAPIDRFFEEVIVNAPEADKREARLALLARFRDAVHQVADFSRIEG
ncbi:MAG: glycine--tRNA ligase subunit beta, partial [Erythrobacter sp.]|jgi:glycyl-tRNA synthetase beta chain|nr:glycine--tRNA ligase subunit beta [Erythrobacter sp.]